ncbi:MAG: hypothetical protein FWF82_05280, partial [Oscillospiraceae bacterium]|nr:hypothetical protein [Oscillospiraceae bacterium]
SLRTDCHPSAGGEFALINENNSPPAEGWHKFPQKFVTGWSFYKSTQCKVFNYLNCKENRK